jgi:tetratricopeptide (TPR) repeat protein
MNGRDAVGLAAVVVLYIGTLVGIWLVDRRAKKRIEQEKMSGRLPARRLHSPPQAMSPVLTTALVAFGVFAPVVLWFFAGTFIRLLTPPAARGYLAPLPTFSEALRWNLNWWLFWAGVAFLAWVAARLGDRLMKGLADPAVSRAEELIKAGELDGAIGELREAIDADGPSVARWNTLANALVKQERWAEVLEVSLDIGDRRRLDIENRRRKALALCKLGLPEVGLSELNRVDATSSRRLAEICSYCQALSDLGLFDRAWDQLRGAEVLYGRGTIPEAEGPQLRKQIDLCRARLTGHFADDKPSGFDEL